MSARTMTSRRQAVRFTGGFAEVLCHVPQVGADSLLLGTLAFDVGPAKLLGSRRYPKSELIQKLEAGDRDILSGILDLFHYKGKRHAMLLKKKSRIALYIP